MYPDDIPLYAKIYCRVLQPWFETMRGKITPGVEKQIGASQWDSPEVIADRQWVELEKLLSWAKEKVPFYHRWFRDAKLTVNDIIGSRDLSALPLIDKPTITADPASFQADPLPEGSYNKTTGGTMGQPLSFMLDPDSDNWRNAMSRRGYAWAGCVPGRSQLHIWSADLAPLPKPALIKRGIHRLLQRQHYVNYYKTLSADDLETALRSINRIRPDNIIAYPSGAHALAERALQIGWRPRKPLVSVLTGAEALGDHQRELIERAFGCPAFETYGSREFMLMASECEAHQGLHISAENLMIEVVNNGKPAAPGELGEVVVTDLHNYAQPFIRYTAGDVASYLPGGVCSCGRGLPRLGKVEGRVADMIVTPDGRRLTGLFFPHLLKDFEAIESYQIEQDRPDHLIIRLKLRAPLAPEQADQILSTFRNTLPGVEPEIEVVDEVKTNPTGKARITIGLGAGG